MFKFVLDTNGELNAATQISSFNGIERINSGAAAVDRTIWSL
jgi:hypothetical protein